MNNRIFLKYYKQKDIFIVYRFKFLNWKKEFLTYIAYFFQLSSVIFKPLPC